MKQLIIDDCVYQIHPVCSLCAASDNGFLTNIVKQIPYEVKKK